MVDGPNGAREMAVRNMEWRQAKLPIELTPEIKEELRKGKFVPAGKDIEGNPLIVVRSRCFDPKERDLRVAISAAVYTVEEAVAMLPDGRGKSRARRRLPTHRR